MKSDRLGDAIEHISEALVESGRVELLPIGTVLIVVRGMILARAVPVAVTTARVAINQDIKALICKPRLDPEYLLSFLQSRENELLAVASTAAHGTRKLDTSDLLAVRVPLPPLDEQRRIVDLLERAAGIWWLREQALAKTRAIVQALFVDMFVRNLERQKWPKIYVGDLAAKHKVSIRTGPFGSALKHSEFISSGIPVLGIDNALTNEFRWAKTRCLPPEKFAKFKQFQVLPADLIVTIMGKTGRVCVAPMICRRA